MTSRRKKVISLCWLFIFTIIGVKAYAIPIQDLPDLTSITFWEQSGPIRQFTFGVNSQELTTKLADPLAAPGNYDFWGVPEGYGGLPGELYDVFYSDADGTFNLNGEYLTITAIYPRGRPWGGGLNINQVGLNFSSLPIEYADRVASFVMLGDTFIFGSELNAVDGDVNTSTTMGNNIGDPGRMRLTLGFASPLTIPEPTTFFLLGAGLAASGFLARARRK